LADLERIPRLGRGVDARGLLADDAIDRAIAALRDVVDRARALGVTRIAAVGTSAVRDAQNRDLLIARARDATGVTIDAIDGAREAALTFRGSLPGIELEGPRTVIDVGGGSTEIVCGRDDRAIDARSVDVGSVRLYERHLRSEPPRPDELAALEADVDAALDRAGISITAPLVALAGTACTLASIAGASTVHGARIDARELHEIAMRLAAMTIDERRATPGVPAGREDVIAAGALLLDRIVRRAGADEIIVSTGGVRWGLAIEMLERP
ncbi:MAG: hypothetical protein M3Y87_23710, partial [Myxococcota bacterium]|nr:hypothetical protein [Myxococcota bacterium]